MTNSPILPTLKVQDRNILESFLPIRSAKSNKKTNQFDWQTITGLMLSYITKKEIKNYDLSNFQNDCKEHFETFLDEPSFWDVLQRMYFVSEDIYKTSPLFLLFRAQYSNGQKDLGSASWRMASLFSNLLGNASPKVINGKLNFIEKEILEVLNSKLIDGKAHPHQEIPYLPYLSAVFKQDIEFLYANPEYLLQELENTLKLYAFTYCSQLALNIKGWSKGEPKSKPLYFILDSEKASNERTFVQKYGFKFFSEASKDIFPILSALEALQFKDEAKRPLWQIFKELEESENKDEYLLTLKDYLTGFIESRELDISLDSVDDLSSLFTLLQKASIEQFHDKHKKTTRHEVYDSYAKELEEHVCSHFIQSRGRSGRVLVLNQDQLLLLTNLSIGNREKLRLHELLTEFENRGFYLDKQSHLVLVSFYERMGNVERMSDSGDAFYVRKTV